MPTAFRVLDAANPSECADWLSLWERWPDREVFAHPAFVSLFATRTGARAFAAVCDDGESLVIYPFALSTVASEPSWPTELRDACEISTPYGYGGAFMHGNPAPQSFWPRFDEWAREHHVLSELVRFSLFPEQQLAYPVEREERLSCVVRSLDVDSETLWMDVDQKVRKNVRRAERAGLRVIVDTDGRRLDEFLRILNDTLDRRGASRSAYFPRELFESMHARLAGQFAYFHALDGDAIVSTELVLVSAKHLYSFLGGTDAASFANRPNDLLKYEIMRWGQAQGKRRFVLGAGFAGEDGIFRYKQSFAPRGVVPFFVGRRVFLPVLHEQLIALRAERRARAAAG